METEVVSNVFALKDVLQLVLTLAGLVVSLAIFHYRMKRDVRSDLDERFKGSVQTMHENREAIEKEFNIRTTAISAHVDVRITALEQHINTNVSDIKADVHRIQESVRDFKKEVTARIDESKQDLRHSISDVDTKANQRITDLTDRVNRLEDKAAWKGAPSM